MSTKESNNKAAPELVIFARPQISVSLTEYDEIEISTASISDSFQDVKISEVIIPLESVQEVAEAMLNILKKRS